MKQILIKKGRAEVEDVPAPIAGDKEILVHVHYSCISTGTETTGLKVSGMPLYKKAIKQPYKVKKALDMLRDQGLAKTVARIKSKLDTGSPTGYSASGIVLDVGSEIEDIKPGDKVACAGAGIANHAEFIAVPRNLTARVPDHLSLELASTVTLGSIAMQGVRRASPQLGDFVAVLGLGILGQLSIQMLKASGCKVIGVDLEQNRIDLALSSGLNKGLNPAKDNVVEEIKRFSNGYGVDCTMVTAASESSDVVNQAIKLCRKKGKVVVVGLVGLDLKRDDFYKKELDLLISTSYGPGRYDAEYETKGKDYPYAYVRWTENRNMEEYLQLLNDKKLDIKSLIAKTWPVEEAPEVYEELKDTGSKPLMVILEYNKESVPERKVITSERKVKKDKIKIALIGAGSFAQGTHLPNLQKLDSYYDIRAIVSKTGSNAKNVAKQYMASYATTDINEVLKDEEVDLVLIATRHNLHAQMANETAKAGKAILLEKPMALNEEELKKMTNILEKEKVPFMIGFNRRFSPFMQKMKEMVNDRQNPLIINYRMNAGFIPKDSWLHSEEGGGRNIGEACHIYDLFNFFTESEVESIAAQAIDPKTDQYANNDNFIATVKYKDGSVCNLVYTALGTKEVSKEQMDIYVDGKIINLNDYKKLETFGTKMKGLETKFQQKGQYEELIEFAKSIKTGDGYPIPLWQLIQATEISFEVERMIKG